MQWKLYYFGSTTVDPFQMLFSSLVGRLVGLELEIRFLCHKEVIFAVNEPTNNNLSNLIRKTNVKQ